MAKIVSIPLNDVETLRQYVSEYVNRYQHRVRVLSEIKGQLEMRQAEAGEQQQTIKLSLDDDARSVLARMVEELPDDDADYYAYLLHLDGHVGFEVSRPNGDVPDRDE